MNYELTITKQKNGEVEEIHSKQRRLSEQNKINLLNILYTTYCCPLTTNGQPFFYKLI